MDVNNQPVYKSNRLASALLGLAIGASAMPRSADAAVTLATRSDSEYLALAADFAGSALWLKAGYGASVARGSAVRINDEWILTAAHVLMASSTFSSPLTSIDVGNGSNSCAPIYA